MYGKRSRQGKATINDAADKKKKSVTGNRKTFSVAVVLVM